MDIETVHYVNVFLGAGTILTQVFLLFVIILLVSGTENKILALIKKYFIEIAFSFSLFGFLVSTFYSEVVGYLPCFHCWVQRIFVFPQVFLFGVAWLRKDRNVLWYSLPLLVAGLLDAIYLIYIYYFQVNSAPCDASGISCTLHYVSEFNGYISIPTISLTGILTLLTFLAVAHFYQKDNKENFIKKFFS